MCMSFLGYRESYMEIMLYFNFVSKTSNVDHSGYTCYYCGIILVCWGQMFVPFVGYLYPRTYTLRTWIQALV